MLLLRICDNRHYAHTYFNAFCKGSYAKTALDLMADEAELVASLEKTLLQACLLPSLCLSSHSVLMNLLSEPQPYSNREPSCRKASGGYNELGVYPGFPDLRPMTSSIKEVLHLSETVGPKLMNASPGPCRQAGATDFHLFLFVFIIP